MTPNKPDILQNVCAKSLYLCGTEIPGIENFDRHVFLGVLGTQYSVLSFNYY